MGGAVGADGGGETGGGPPIGAVAHPAINAADINVAMNWRAVTRAESANIRER